MMFSDFQSFLKWAKPNLGKGPHAIIFAEDDVQVAQTVQHHIDQGFHRVIVIGDDVPSDIADGNDAILHVNEAVPISGDVHDMVNQVIDIANGSWIFYCFNAEYLFFPFCETRSIGELVTFSAEERRDAILTYVIDLYAPDLSQAPSGVARKGACLDRSGYYALSRCDEWENPIDRQMDFYGGLRWRFEEHVPKDKRRIDRISIFKSAPGLKLAKDHTFNEPEYNTYSCPWHHNITAAVCSFRTAKALKRNPSSSFDIETFHWHNSVTFDWSSQQLMELGLMEPGQWF